MIEGLFGKPSEFTRTPKYGIEGASDTWKQKGYKGKSNWVPYVELAARLLLHLHLDLYALAYGLVGTLPFIAIFQWGFLYTSGMSLAQSSTGSCRASRRPEHGAVASRPDSQWPDRHGSPGGGVRRVLLDHARPEPRGERAARWSSATSRAASRWWPTATTAWSTARTT